MGWSHDHASEAMVMDTTLTSGSSTRTFYPLVSNAKGVTETQASSSLVDSSGRVVQAVHLHSISVSGRATGTAQELDVDITSHDGSTRTFFRSSTEVGLLGAAGVDFKLNHRIPNGFRVTLTGTPSGTDTAVPRVTLMWSMLGQTRAPRHLTTSE